MPAPADGRHDVLAFGEAMLRLQPEDEGRLEEACRLRLWVGGAELNTCTALAGMGLWTSFFSVVPEGPLGRRVARHLRSAGVDDGLLRRAPGRLGVYWVEFGREPRGIEVLYDRRDSAVCQVRAEDAPWEALRRARAFYVTGITPALSPSTQELALRMAEAARTDGVAVVVDVNYRARLWSPVEAAPVLERLARSADVVIATREDLGVLWGWTGEPAAVATLARQRFGSSRFVLTCGDEGAVSIGDDGVRQGRVFASAPVDRVGAGDAFAAGLLYATLTGRAERDLEYGLAMAALKRAIPGDALVTTPEEVERVLARRAVDISR